MGKLSPRMNSDPSPAGAALPSTGPQSRPRLSGPVKVALAAAFLLLGVLVGLRSANVLIPFTIPTGSMKPAIQPGDHVISESFSFFCRPPHRGDIVVFENEFTTMLPDHCYCCKRVAGEPGEHLRIIDGRLYINGRLTSLTNLDGPIAYRVPPAFADELKMTDVVIPPGKYFVLGDNSTNSNDSRFFGFVPANRIVGRIDFRFWPPSRAGAVE